MLTAAVLMLPWAGAAPAEAAPVTWYRTGANGPDGYRALATGPGTAAFDTTVTHGSNTGAFRFAPGTSSATSGFPGGTASGVGYATPTAYTGTIPGGRWTLEATLRTDVPADTAQGVAAVAIYAVGASGSRRLAFVQGSTNVLAGPGNVAVTLATDLGAVTLQDERIATEWYLVVSRNAAGAAGSQTSLRHGAAGDSVTIPGPPDAPTLGAPGTLQVTGTGDNRVSLSWGASSDARVTGYVVRRADGPSGPWTDLSTVTGTTYTDTGLTNGARVYHSVQARAADGSRSAPSNATSAVPSDTVAPSSPTSPAVAASGSFRLQVSWTASTSPDVAGYEVQRSAQAGGPFTRVAGPLTATTFTDDGLPSGSTWYYRVVAIDDDGLRSVPTPPAAGNVAPAPPSELRVTAVADGAVALEWRGVAGAAEYVVERDSGSGFVAVARPTGTSHTDGGLTNGTAYRYRIRAVDGSGAASSPSSTVTATPRDTGLPAPPTGLTTTARGDDGVRLSWTASGSASTVGYRVQRAREDGSFTTISGLLTTTRYDDGPLSVGVPFRYRVVAEDASGTTSIPATASFTVAPSAPTRLAAPTVNETTVQLTWQASDDPRAGYRVLRGERASGPFAAVSGLLTDTTFTDGGLSLGEEYHYVVVAESVDGTRSPASRPLRVVPVNGPPTPPTGLTAVDTGAGAEVSLSWSPNPEPDVVRYRIERSREGGEWRAIASRAATTYLDQVPFDGESYRYRIVAVDSVGFESAPSAIATAVPTDQQAPSPPPPPIVRQTGFSLSLVWLTAPSASSYEVLRSTSPNGPFETIAATSERNLIDSDVRRGVTYHYAIRSVDRAGNRSVPGASSSGVVRASEDLAPLPPGTGNGSGLPPLGPGQPGGGPGGFVGGELFPPGFLDPDPPIIAPPPGAIDDPTVGAPVPSEEGSPGAAFGPPVASATTNQEIREDAQAASRFFGSGDFGRALGATARDVGTKVGDVAQTFRIPLVLLLLLGAYLIVQGRIDRGAILVGTDAATGGEDDDVEYLL